MILAGCCTTGDQPMVSTAAPAAVDAVVAAPEPADVVEPRQRQRQSREAMMVRAIQTSLTRIGYETGFVDGVAGPKTRAAIRQYQANNGLVADGEPTPRLVEDLKTRLSRPRASPLHVGTDLAPPAQHPHEEAAKDEEG
jgi:peptidoglycan hydrolase-like protein with peptidoglycan-binding domain